MNYSKNTIPSNCDVYWLSFTPNEVLSALSALAGRTFPSDVRIDMYEDGSIEVEWQTPKGANQGEGGTRGE